MGQKSNTETIVAILKAFLDQRTWTQAALADHLGMGRDATRKRLVELQSSGIPLTDDREHPHVYWNVPKTWFPGAIALSEENITEMHRLLSRLPKSKTRTQLVDILLRHSPVLQRHPSVQVPPVETEREETHLPTIEDAAIKKTVLAFRYTSAKVGVERLRYASVHRVTLGPPARFIATCHTSETLKWFRVESVASARLDGTRTFLKAQASDVNGMLKESLEGFHGGGAPKEHQFFVREPECRWVAKNLLPEMTHEPCANGIQVRVVTSALPRLAAYVVGLGAAASPTTKDLKAAVRSLAEGALASIATGAT